MHEFVTTRLLYRVLALGALAASAGAVSAQDYAQDKAGITQTLAKKQFSPYVGREFPTRALFGETHLHTAISVDAGTMCTVGQEDAFRFARGEEITTTHGLRARLSRPLDFMVLTDHAEMYGLMPALKRGDPDLLRQEKGRKWYDSLSTGVFTALIGYEYTTRGGYNLHRNVVFRGDASVASRTVPFLQYDSQNLEDLWRELAELRARMEPVVELTQIKGDGETHPFLSPDDEFADYEKWDKSNLNGTEAKKSEMLQYEYAREALKNGLVLEAKLGVNPFKFGMIGSTDSHTAMSTAEEDNFFGKHSGVEPEPHRWEHVVIEAPNPDFKIRGWLQAAAGLAVVWANENTREAIFDAMMRKETHATTGTRIMVRFFGGWEFTEQDAKTRMPAGVGYAKGVPMGGDLRSAPRGASPTFLVGAMKDVWSGDRKPGANGKLPPVGNTLDVKNATWTNKIGSPELITVWKDPDFDPRQRAFYYARVIEIPTPRWTACEAKRFNITMPSNVPMVTQERAYTSPIWYTP